MRAPHCLLLFALLLACKAVAAATLDPRHVDIIGLHLGMTRQSLLDRLAAEGIAADRIHEQTGHCATDPAKTCVTRLTAPTRDGSLLIRFVARNGPGTETAWSIAYTLRGRGAGEPEMIRNAVLEHFGPPTSSDPPTWCADPGCGAPGQPQLSYREGPDTSSTLTLSDPGALNPAPR